MVPSWLQLQDALDSTRLDLYEQLQQLSSRSRAFCQALKGAVDLVLHCIRTTSEAAGSITIARSAGLSSDNEQLALSPANAEAIAAMVDLTVSEVSLHATHLSCILQLCHTQRPGAVLSQHSSFGILAFLHSHAHGCIITS